MPSQNTQARPSQAATDRELVDAAVAGDAQAFSQLHDRHHAKVYRFAIKRLRNAQDAEDVTQEVFLQVHLSLSRYEGRSSFLTWVFGIAHHRVCRFHRRKHPHLTLLDERRAETLASDQAPVDRAVDASRVLERFDQVVQTHLSPSQRQAIDLRIREAQSGSGAAKKAGKTPGAMKGCVFRARRVLLERTAGLETFLAS